jgi:predicted nicotinamide N-methyase
MQDGGVRDVAEADFVRRITRLGPVPFVPEIQLYQAGGLVELWEGTGQTEPPFWGYPWAGGQALARLIVDRPELVAGRHVLDLAAGSGLVAIAAARSGAARVRATEIDPYATATIGLNAAANGVDIEVLLADILDGDGGGAEVVLAGDVFYSREMTRRVVAFLERCAGATILVGDPGRAYLPREKLEEVTRYDIPVIRELEDTDIKPTTVWRLTGR